VTVLYYITTGKGSLPLSLPRRSRPSRTAKAPFPPTAK